MCLFTRLFASTHLQNLMKQSSLDDQESLGMELDSVTGDNGDDLGELSEFDERRPPENTENNQMYSNYPNRPTSPPLQSSVVVPRGLPWKPKVRQKDIDLFLDTARLKFVGYSLQGDRESLAGLPLPIHEGVKTLKEVSNRNSHFICRYTLTISARLYLLSGATDTKRGRNRSQPSVDFRGRNRIDLDGSLIPGDVA